jgi:hypothetical protein
LVQLKLDTQDLSFFVFERCLKKQWSINNGKELEYLESIPLLAKLLLIAFCLVLQSTAQ